MKKVKDNWQGRWEVLVRCKDCSSTYVCKHVDPCSEALNGTRIILVPTVDVCPKCRNLRLVKGDTK